LRVKGSQPNLNITLLWEMESASCPSLSGDGVVGDVTGCGHLTLDSTLSVRNISRGVCGTCYYNTLTIRLNGTNVGEYGKLVASGDVSVNTGSLLASPGFTPQAGQVFTIVEKTSPGAITNPFLGPEGTITYLNGMSCRISYFGGDGNDLTLTVQAPTFSDANWISSIPGLNGQVTAAVVDGAGNLYIGGTFTIGGDVFATNIAKWNGSRWSALGSGISGGDLKPIGAPYALAVSGSDLYVGGHFTRAGGTPAHHIAKWNGTNWSAL